MGRLAIMLGAAALALAACDRGGDAPATAEGGSTAGGGSAVRGGASENIRPGLWRTVQRTPGEAPKTEEQCVTPEEAKLDAADFSEMPEGCTQSTGQEGGAFVFRASCPTGPGMPPSQMEMRIRTQGETRYSGSMSVSMDVPQQGRQTFTTEMEGTWIGPCPAGGEDSAAE